MHATDVIRETTTDVIEGPAGFSIVVRVPCSAGVSLIELTVAVLDKYLTHRTTAHRYVSNIKIPGCGARDDAAANPSERE